MTLSRICFIDLMMMYHSHGLDSDVVVHLLHGLDNDVMHLPHGLDNDVVMHLPHGLDNDVVMHL